MISVNAGRRPRVVGLGDRDARRAASGAHPVARARQRRGAGRGSMRASSGPIPGVAAISSSRGVAQPRERSEPLEERLLPGRPDAGHLVERRHQRALRPLLPVIGDGEPVRLVADVLQDEQRLGRRAGSSAARAGPGSRPPPAASPGRCAGCPARRSASTLLHTPSCPLPPSTTTSDGGYAKRRLRRRDRLVPLPDQPGEPPPEHLLHAGEVVLSGDALDLEPAGSRSASGSPSSNTTIEPTVSVSPRFEMS